VEREVNMALVKDVEAAEASPEVKEVYEQKYRGKPNSMAKALAHRPEILKSFLPFYASIGRALGRRLYELVYIRVAMTNGCRYCLQHHLAASKRAGITEDDWKGLRDAAAYNGFSEAEKAAILYAERLTRTPTGDIRRAEVTELKKHFSDESLVDLHATIALANLTNRLSDGLRLELEMAEQEIPA
jgi:uncharacterized peroxidase-related enzyme